VKKGNGTAHKLMGERRVKPEGPKKKTSAQQRFLGGRRSENKQEGQIFETVNEMKGGERE